MQEKQGRERNYEILRIVAMLMIVCLHYLSKGGALGNPAEALTSSGYAAWLIEAFCLSAVNVYVLISGYFGIGEKKTQDHPLSMKKVLQRPVRIWLQVMFYSVLIGMIALLIGLQEFDIYTAFMYLFPVVTEHYWFATAYLLLTLFMPFLNAGFERLEKRAVEGILFCMLLIFSVAKTVLPMQLPWDHKGYDVLWFVCLYLTGAYIRRYGIRGMTPHKEEKEQDIKQAKKKISPRIKALGLYIGSTLLIFLSMLVIRFWYQKTGSLADFISYGYSYNFLFCYLASIGLFLAFQSRKSEKEKKPCGAVLQTISGATFGVYLIHEHVNLRYLWPTWFQSREAAADTLPEFLLHMVITVCTVYAVCTLIEAARRKLVHRSANS